MTNTPSNNSPNHPSVDPREPWVTKADLSRHLKRSTRWIERRHRDGLPSCKPGENAHRRYQIGAVEDWLDGLNGCAA